MMHFFVPTENNNHRPHLLKSKALGVYCLLLLGIQLGFNLIKYPQGEVLAATTITASDLFSLTNTERTKLGLSNLTYNAKLAQAAANKGADMFADQYWAHIAPDGTTPWDFILGAGYDYHYAGENLAKDFSVASAVVKAWMNSPTHRENIVNTNYKDMGIAVVSGVFDGEETTICVQMFGTLMPQNTQTGTTTPTQNTTTPTQNTSPTTPTNNQPVKNPTIEPAKDTTPPAAPILTNPSTNTITNNDRPEITGYTNEKATVSIFDAQQELGQVPTDSQNAFSYRPEKPLKEGEHLFSATARDASNNVSEHSAITTLIIDTFPPFIDSEGIKLETFYRYSLPALRVSLTALADPKKVMASIGDYNLILSETETNTFTGVLVPPENYFQDNKQIQFSAIDEAGNRTVASKDIPTFPVAKTTIGSGTVLGTLQEASSRLIATAVPRNAQETGRIFYSLFGIGLMGLLVLNTAIIERKKIETNGANTLTHAAIIGISLMGVIWGNLGVINTGLSIIK